MQKPIGENIFTWPSDEPQLLGGQCSDCAAVTFPTQSRCPRCGTKTMEELALPRRGTLVSFTTQAFAPVVPYAGDPTAKNFETFGVGLIELDGVVRVEGRLTESDPAKLDFGMELELQILPFYTDANGDEIMTFAFAPTVASAAAGSGTASVGTGN